MQWYRAIGIEQLVGSIGGYVGLCLGFSIAQIPELIICMMIFTKKEYQKVMDKTNRILTTEISVVVKNTSQKDNETPITKQGSQHQTEIRTMTQMKIELLEIRIEEASQTLLDLKKELYSNKI